MDNKLKKENNIFSFANKELSQDAFLCWLINNFNSSNSELREISKKFLQLIFKKKYNKEIPIKSVDVIKQYKNIDVLIIVNVHYFIILEDKILTIEHDRQINRYSKILEQDKTYKNIKNKDIIAVYYKMFDENDNHEVRITRDDMYLFFLNIHTDNYLLNDYKKYIYYLKEMLCKEHKIKDWNNVTGYYDKFIFDFNNSNNYDDNKKARKSIVRGSIYIDWYKINYLKSKTMNIENIYLSLNFNNDTYRISILGSKIQNYNKNERKKINEELNQYVKKYKINITPQEFIYRKASKTMLLACFSIDENTNNNELINIMKKMEIILENYNLEQ